MREGGDDKNVKTHSLSHKTINSISSSSVNSGCSQHSILIGISYRSTSWIAPQVIHRILISLRSTSTIDINIYEIVYKNFYTIFVISLIMVEQKMKFTKEEFRDFLMSIVPSYKDVIISKNGDVTIVQEIPSEKLKDLKNRGLNTGMMHG